MRISADLDLGDLHPSWSTALSTALAATRRAYLAGDYGEALRGLLTILDAEIDFPLASGRSPAFDARP